MASALLLVSSIAAAGPFGTKEDAFDAFTARLDRDGDGQLTAAEYALTGDPGTYSELDVDADGQVTRSELRAWVTLTDPRPVSPPRAADAPEEPPPPSTRAVAPPAAKPFSAKLSAKNPTDISASSGFSWNPGWLAVGGVALLALLIGFDARARRGLRALVAPRTGRRGSR